MKIEDLKANSCRYIIYSLSNRKEEYEYCGKKKVQKHISVIVRNTMRLCIFILKTHLKIRKKSNDANPYSPAN